MSNLSSSVAVLKKRLAAILEGKELLPSTSIAAFNLGPLIGLPSTVPPNVAERSLNAHSARVIALANHQNQNWQFDWQSKLRRFRVLCLCAERSNPLLWSHYADSHRGVALEFDTEVEGGFFRVARPVRYQRRVPRVFSRMNFIENALGFRDLPDRGIYPLVLTKSLEWTYEQEWRIVLMADEGDQSLFSDSLFTPRSLSKIFLGCRISTRDRNALQKLATGDFAHVEVHLARQSQTRFGLEFDRIS